MIACLALLLGIAAWFSDVGMLSANAAGGEECGLYPIALSSQNISGVPLGTRLSDVWNGSGPGNFGWLTWAGSPSVPTLVTSLTHPGDSQTYVNPDNRDDHQVAVGDWVQGKPGVSNAKNVREALNALKNRDITVPLWDAVRGQGANVAYRVSGFGKVRLLSYQLAGHNRITARWLGTVSCGTQNQAPVVNAGPDQVITLPSAALLAGSVTDDGLPAGGTLTLTWTQVSGTGEAIFAQPHSMVTTAAFTVPGIYLLRLTASDSQLTASDEVLITVNRENHPPVAYPQSLVVQEDLPLDLSLQSADPDGDALSFIIALDPRYGTLSGTPPHLRYIPKPDYNGPDSFAFKVTDGFLESDTNVVLITVVPANDAPVVDDQNLSTLEDTPVAVILSGADVDADPLTYAVTQGPTNGSLTGTAPYLTYTPPANFHGTDALLFHALDGTTNSRLATVAITVVSVNDAPEVEAGPDQIISLPVNRVSLDGTVTDDLFLDANSIEVAWSQLSGPGAVVFGDAQSPDTTATFSQPGVYVLRLTASDQLFISSDELVITVNSGPVVEAGPDQITTYPDGVTLVGAAWDDGLPTNASLAMQWSKVSGPGTVHFADPTGSNTVATFSEGGLYVLRLAGSDGLVTGADEVSVTVNRAPWVDAGSDQAVNHLWADLGGSVADDGFPVSVAAAPLWRVVSGSGSVEFENPSSPTTRATFSQSGVYVLRLSADDSLAQSADEVTITINLPPFVTAGPDQVIALPNSATLSGEVSDDGFPTDLLNIAWSQVSGPGAVVFSPPDQAITHATFTLPGSYVLRLSATDASAPASDEVQVEVVASASGLPPAVDAGPDQVLGLSGTASLMGSVTPNGHSGLAIHWSQLTGPGAVQLDQPHAPTTEATFPVSGVYVLRLSAGNGSVSASDEVTVTIHLNNHPPLVRAGEDQTITVPSGLVAPAPIAAPPASGVRDNRGMDYWLAFPGNIESYPEALELFVTSQTNTSVSVTAPGLGFFTNVPINAGLVTVVSLPMALEIQSYDTNELKGVHLTAGAEVTVYAMNRHRGSTGAYLALPLDALGTNYLVLAYRDTYFSGSKFVVIATEDGTRVTITPTVSSYPRMGPGIRWAGVPFTITLNRGETYQYMGTHESNAEPDVSGSRVVADKPIGVWGGHKCATVPNNMPCDMIIEQLPPLQAWGRSAATLPMATRKNGDTVRILASTTNTEVRLNGIVVTNLNAGRFYERIVTGPAYFTADQPILVAQYGHAFSYDGVEYSDSAMSLVPPAEQFLDSYTLLVPPGRYVTNFLHITAPISALGAIRLDDVPLSTTNFAGIGPSGLLGAQLQVTPGIHTLTSPVPFGVQAYGYAYADGYSYPGGMALAPLSRAAHLNLVAAATNCVDGLQWCQAMVSDHGDQPVAGMPVQFVVSGVHSFTRSAVTATNGVATFSYRGEFIGNDIIQVFAGTLSNAVAVVWQPQPPEPVVTAPLHGSAQDDGLPSVGALTAQWSLVSGPVTPTFSASTSAITTVTFPQAGEYHLRLTGTDSELAVSDDVIVTVSFNQRPTVHAGPDHLALTTNFVALSGTAQDDGLPSGRALDVFWKKVSGPGEVIFDDAASTATTVRFAQSGVYVLRLTAFDGEFSARDEVTVGVQSGGFPNQAPTVQAPADQTLSLPHASLTLVGSASDDGLPADSHLTAAWSQVSGPSAVTFSDAFQLVTTASFSVAGYYRLRLTVSDGQLSAQDEVAITVNPANAAPVVHAGWNQAVGLFDKAVLNSTINDDGWPVGSLTVTWSQVSGPGTVRFSTLNGVYRARFSAPGEYVLRLTAHDLELSANDEVSVTVFDAPEPPAVAIQALADASIVTAPTIVTGTVSSAILQQWVLQYRLKPAEDASDLDWTPLATGTASVTGAPLAPFDPTLLLNGTYELQLTATDLLGRASSTEPVTVIVDRNMKVGHFTVSFNDLTIPVAGIPIQVIRTYDSRDKRVGEFGVGWTLGIKNVRLQKNRNVGLNWEQTTTGGAFASYCLTPRRPRVVTITFPDGRTCKFQAAASPTCQFGVPITGPRIVYQPLENTRGSMVSLSADADQVLVAGSVPGAVDLLEYDGGLYNPSLFQYTSDAGEVFVIDEREGLRRMTDRNGHTLTLSTNGIYYSASPNGPPLKSVIFHRNTQGCITNIVDPAGSSLFYQYDASGNLAAFVDRENHTHRFGYNLPGRLHHLTDLTDARGIQALRNLYDDRGRLIAQVDANHRTNHFTHDLEGRRELTTDRLGNTTIHWYDDHGNVVQSQDPLGHLTRFAYDAKDNLIEQVDSLGRTNRFAYDSQDNRIAATDPLGHTTRLTFDAQHRPTSVTDARGHTLTNSYDAAGNLLWLRDPLGTVTTFGYQGGNLVAVTNAHGDVTRFDYDGVGQLARRVDAHGHAISYTRDANGNVLSQTTTRTTGAGIETLVTLFQHDRQGRVTNVVSPDGSSSSTIFNAIGKPAVTTDPLGRQTRFDYDEQGRLVRTTFPDGSSEASAFDLEGRLIARTNRLGHVTQLAYDPLDRLMHTEFADGATTTNYYDGAGQLVTASDARGFTTFYGYDVAGRNSAVTNALLQVARCEYDAAGNLIAAVDPLGRITRFHYDALNRRTQTDFADGTRTATWFDALGRRIVNTDPNTNTTWVAYDALGRLTAGTNALGHVTRYTYDELGQLLAQTDANLHTTTFAYDAMGRRISRSLPGGQTESYAYNPTGLLTSQTDFNDYTTTFLYDAMDRLTEKIPDARRGEPTVSFRYDALGRRTNMVDASGHTGYRYDVRHRLVEKIKTWAATGLTVALAYGYDANGNLASLQSSSLNGTAVAYEYDALNRLSAVNDSRVGRTAYAYDDAGNLQTCVLPNGLAQAYRYDALHRLTNLTTLSPQRTTVADYAYTLSPAGRRLTATETRVLDSQPWTLDRLYTYDAAYRLINETIGETSSTSPQLAYTYDPVGNRLTRDSGLALLPSQAFAFNSNDRLSTDAYDGNGNTLAGHDGFGALLGTDRYDFENRLIERQPPPHSSSPAIACLYDGDGQRVAKTVNGATTFYVVDDLNPTGYAQVLEELSTFPAQPPTIGVTSTYTYGHARVSQDQLRADGQGGWAWATSFYGTDGHGSVRTLTDLGGQATDTYDYDAFGNLIAQSGTTPNHYLYAGEQFDPDLSLYYLRARYHNPHTGRFWTAAPCEGFRGDPASLHRYTYCANNPVNAVDPSGLYTLAEVRVATAIASTLNSIGVDAGVQTLLRGQAELTEAGVSHPELYAAIEMVLWYQLVSDLSAGYSLGRLGSAVLPNAGRAFGGAVASAFNRLRQITPKQWLDLKLWAPKPIAQAAGRAEQAVSGFADVSPMAVKGGEHGVSFFDSKIANVLDNPAATLGRASEPHFFMPLEDAASIRTAADAARQTGMAPSVARAYTSETPVYGVSFPTEGLSVRIPTAANANGWPHFLEGGRTAVATEGANGGVLLNSTREFVVPGGGAMPKGSVLFRLGPNGAWTIIRRY